MVPSASIFYRLRNSPGKYSARKLPLELTQCNVDLIAGGRRENAELKIAGGRRENIARFRLDPRDRRGDEDFYELIGDDNGVFGYMSLLACHDVCPKNLPLSTQIAFLRRKMASVGWK